MRLTRSKRSVVAPFWQPAAQAWQIALAAPQVVAARSVRLATAGPFPAIRDRHEYTRMWSEKVAAFSESWTAMAAQMQRSSLELARAASQQWWSAVFALSPLGSFTSPAKSRARLMRASTSPITPRRVSGAVARVATSGLRPVRRRVTANAKRLGRSKRR